MYRFLTKNKPTYNPLQPTIVEELTTDSVIATLGLDTWRAEKIPNYREDAKEVGQSFMIRRFNNNPETSGDYHDTVLKPYVGEKYRTLQYDKGIRWLDPFLMEDLLNINSVFFVERGTKLCVTSELGIEAEVVPGDVVRRYLILVLSHDGSQRMLGWTDICPVCENTLAMAVAQSFNKAEKAFALDDEAPEKSLEKARETIDLVRQVFYTDSLLKYGAYAELPLEDSQIDYIIRSVINAPLKEEPQTFSEKLYTKYKGLYKALNESPGQHLRGNANGYGLLSAVSNFGKGIIGDTEMKQYLNDQFGTGRRMRKHTMELLDQLLPENYIQVSEPVAASL